MRAMSSSRPFAEHFKYTYTVSEERTVLVPMGPTSVILGEHEPSPSSYSQLSKENYPHLKETESGWKPVDADAVGNSEHVEHKRMDVKVEKTRYDAGSYELLLTLVRKGELTHYGFRTEDGPNIESARSVCEFLSERVTLPYRKEGVDKEKSFGPFIEEEPSEAEVRAMQMLFNGHRRKASAMDPERVLKIVAAVVERDMETLNGLVQKLMEPFMETETVKVPSEDDEDEMVEVEEPTPEAQEQMKQKFALTLEGANA